MLVLMSVACHAPEQLARNTATPPPGGPQITATVITIRTTLQPENKPTMSTIVIGDDLAREAEEIGMWRLFDFKRQRVAFVDDVEKTYRYESLKELQQRHASAALQPTVDGMPRAEYHATGATRPILGLPAAQTLVKLGAYQRELWFADHPAIPPGLFSLMQASELPGPAAPMVKKSSEALLDVRGFPLVDHAEVTFGKKAIVVDRVVTNVGQRKVPESLLVIPKTYREIKNIQARGPRPEASPREPAEHPPAVESPPPDQKTPATGSQSSSTTQTDL